MYFIKQKNHVVDLLFTIALFCVFAVSALSVILIGADVYRSVTKDAQETYGTRTVLSYIAQKFQSCDNGCPARITHQDGIDALTLYETYNEERYVTYIYEDSEGLRELFTKEDASFTPDAGTLILTGTDVSFEEVSEGVFWLSAAGKDGQKAGIYLCTKSEGGNVS